jgi:3-hydroxy-9,10-secoandrosta-1,3,5(10)-triene-9,17-dione monooxygenase reductase component
MIDKIEFRNAMGHFATGVTVVTVLDGQGGIGGLTANAFSSLSLDPPLVLICVDTFSQARIFIASEKVFTIHFLADDQEKTAASFAQHGPNKADGVIWELSQQGIPRLTEYMVALECQLENEFEGGDHTIIVGKVLDISIHESNRPPLTYYKGRINALVPKVD